MISGVQNVNKEEEEEVMVKTKQNADFYFRPVNPEQVQASGNVRFAIGWPRNPTWKKSSNMDSATSGNNAHWLNVFHLSKCTKITTAKVFQRLLNVFLKVK